MSHKLDIAPCKTITVSGRPTFKSLNAEAEVSDQSSELANQPRESNIPAFTFRGPWFSSLEASLYVPCRSVKAFYMWRVRHGIIARSNGSVAKADLDRELNRRKPRRRATAQALANLRRRHVVHAANSTAYADSTVTPVLGASK